MSFNGRIGLSPLSKDKDELAKIGELLADDSEGFLYIKLADGSVVPIKGQSYFTLKSFYEDFWNIGEEEPSEESDSSTWLKTDGYEKDKHKDFKAALMVEREIDGKKEWYALSPHTLSGSVLDEETGETLDKFIKRHEDFYDMIWDIEGEIPDDIEKNHLLNTSGVDQDSNILSAAIMFQNEEENWISLSPTTLAEDVIIDLEEGDSLDQIIPDISELKELETDLVEKINNLEGSFQEHQFNKLYHETDSIEHNAVHGIRVDNETDQMEFAIGESEWLTVVTFKELQQKMGQENGIATLNEDGYVKSSQLPTVVKPKIYIVDTIEERDNLENIEHGDEAYVIDKDIRYIWDSYDNIWKARTGGGIDLIWDYIEEKPDVFPPEVHGDEAHEIDYLTEDDKDDIKESVKTEKPFINMWGGM